MRVARDEARLSERHACGLIGMHRGSWRYRPRESQRCGVASAAAGVGGRASALRLPEIVGDAAAGQERGRHAPVGGES